MSFWKESETVVPNILLMHAEDQLMSAETIKMMALEIIKLNHIYLPAAPWTDGYMVLYHSIQYLLSQYY